MDAVDDIGEIIRGLRRPANLHWLLVEDLRNTLADFLVGEEFAPVKLVQALARLSLTSLFTVGVERVEKITCSWSSLSAMPLTTSATTKNWSS